MYIQPCIKQTLQVIVSQPNFDVQEFKNAVLDFVALFDNKDIFREAFMFNQFEEMCIEIDESRMIGDLYMAEEIEDAQELFDVFAKLLDCDAFTDEQKRCFCVNFASIFGDCSVDEDNDPYRVIVVIKGLNGDGELFVTECEDWDDAEAYVCNTYESVSLDDPIGAERVWYPALCDIRNGEVSYMKNFCAIIEIDA